VTVSDATQPTGGAGSTPSAGGRPVGPYRPVVREGDWVVTSGQVGVAPGADGTPRLVEGGTVGQARQALANLASVLAAEGATLADVVKATLFVVDMGDLGALNELWTETFAEPRPARSAVGVASLPLGAAVEVEAWARVPEPPAQRG
jgi:2-iminobutanoate/2-iminopropanoate deaminase